MWIPGRRAKQVWSWSQEKGGRESGRTRSLRGEKTDYWAIEAIVKVALTLKGWGKPMEGFGLKGDMI